MTRIADERGITEERNATDPMPRMRKMNGIKASVENTLPNKIISRSLKMLPRATVMGYSRHFRIKYGHYMTCLPTPSKCRVSMQTGTTA